MKKLRIGWFTFTCSEDSSIMFVELMNRHFFEWRDKLEFAHVGILSSRSDLKDLDVAFVEGAISGKKEIERLRKVRAIAKKLVAVGACAVTGLPAGQRNSFSEDKMERIRSFLKLHGLNEKVEPVKNFVQVDAEVPGCPMDEKTFLAVLDKYIAEFQA
ncbi:Sulfhydrogenase 1 subunit delta [uncultured archaeon]|nr:Sulfhydrogenase 1 subunit delta [uncultured archaeon]